MPWVCHIFWLRDFISAYERRLYIQVLKGKRLKPSNRKMRPTEANAMPLILLTLPASIRVAAKSPIAPAMTPTPIIYSDEPSQKKVKNVKLRNMFCRVSEYAIAMDRGMHGVKPIRAPNVKVEWGELQKPQTFDVMFGCKICP